MHVFYPVHDDEACVIPNGSFHGLHKVVINSTCLVISGAMDIDSKPTVPIKSSMSNNTPPNQLMMAICMKMNKEEVIMSHVDNNILLNDILCNIITLDSTHIVTLLEATYQCAKVN